MKGRIVLVMKRWWIIALVFTLALSLTSCSGNYKLQNASGVGYAACDYGTLGTIDVWTVWKDGSTLLVDVIAISPTEQGDVVDIKLASNSPQSYTPTPGGSGVLYPNKEILAQFNYTDVANHNILVIMQQVNGMGDPFDPNFPGKGNACELPLPGNMAGGTSGGGYASGGSYGIAKVAKFRSKNPFAKKK